MTCPICWSRRRIRNVRARVVTEWELPDGSTRRTDLTIAENREFRHADGIPAGSKFRFATVAYGRRSARRVTAESVHAELDIRMPRSFWQKDRAA